MTLPPQMPSIVNKSTARGEESHVLTPTRLECCQAWPNLMQATVAGSSWMPQFWGVQKTLFDTSSQPLTYSIFTPFLWWFLNLERKDCGRGVPCVVDHTTNTSSLSLTSYPLHQDPSLMSLKVALLFWLSDTDLEGSLTLSIQGNNH